MGGGTGGRRGAHLKQTGLIDALTQWRSPHRAVHLPEVRWSELAPFNHLLVSTTPDAFASEVLGSLTWHGPARVSCASCAANTPAMSHPWRPPRPGLTQTSSSHKTGFEAGIGCGRDP